LVTGSESQLGKTLKEITPSGGFKFYFTTKSELDITDKEQVKRIFKQVSFDYCLNFAAYTDVNLAEKEEKKCFKVNAKAVGYLAKACKKHNCILIHISTDYVFDGSKKKPYKETDLPNPLNIYGKSKLAGEQIIQQYLKKYLIIRTSWMYSAYNNNFVKTILNLSKKQNEIRLINDQTGTPTFAFDLIAFILFAIRKIEDKEKKKYFGLFHFSNKGKTTWYDFGRKIVELLGNEVKIIPIKTREYPSPAKRPEYSVLSKKKLQKTFDYKVQNWKNALQDFFSTQ
jgi:dTDP-4-dehydrorhamnose reductase